MTPGEAFFNVKLKRNNVPIPPRWDELSHFSQQANETDAAHILAQADEIRDIMISAGSPIGRPIIDASYTEVTREEAEGRRLPTHLPETGS